MKKLVALAAAGLLLSSPAVGVGSQSSLEVHLTDREPIANGTMTSARIAWSLNDAHGIVDERETARVTLETRVTNAVPTRLPSSCIDGEIAGGTLTCVLDVADDDGVAGTLDIPMYAWGRDGDKIEVDATLESLSASADPVVITADEGFDVALNTVGLTLDPVPFTPHAHATTLIPIQVGVPIGYEPLEGRVELDLSISTSAGPDVGDNAEIDIVAIPHRADIVGIASNTVAYPVPEASLSHDGGRLRLAIDIGQTSPTVSDPAGNELDVVPVAGLALRVVYPISDGTNTASAWSVDVERASVNGEVREQVRTTNDSTAISYVSSDGASAKFVNGHARERGGVLADPSLGMEPRSAEHAAVWVPNLGSGVLVGAADNWSGRGTVLPGDQVMALVQNTAYIGGANPSSKVHGMCLGFEDGATYTGGLWVGGLTDYTIEYVTGELPGGFLNLDCGQGSWTEERPEDVRAIRILFVPDHQDQTRQRAMLLAGMLVDEQAPEGSRVWITGSVSNDVTSRWSDPSDVPVIADLGQGQTTSFRDAIEVASSRTSVLLEADETEVDHGGLTTWSSTSMVSEGAFAHDGAYAVHHEVRLPAGLAYVNGSASVDVEVKETDEGQVLSWVNDLIANESYLVTFQTQHTGGAGRHHVAIDVTNHDASTLNEDSSSASVVALDRATAAIHKSIDASEFASGGSNTWRITVDNGTASDLSNLDTIDVLPYNGDDRGTEIAGRTTVTDLRAPEGTSVLVTSADPSSIDPDPHASSNGGIGEPSGIWTEWAGQDDITAIRWLTPTLRAASSLEYAIDFTVEAGPGHHDLINSVQARSGSVPTMINSMSSTVVGEAAHLQVDKKLIGDNASLADGRDLVFEITVKNAGETPVQNVTVTDHPEGLSDVRFVTVDQGSVSDDGLTWNAGELGPGQVVTARVAALATGLHASNQVVVDDCEDCVVPPREECVPNADVESDTDGCDEVELIEHSDLRIDKELVSLDQDSGEVTYRLTVGNLAEAREGQITTARDVVVTDLMGDGLADAHITEVSEGQADGLLWNVGSLEAGKRAEATVTATVTADVFVNGAWVSNPESPRQLEHPRDAQPNDSLETDTDQADVVVSQLEGRLAIDKVEIGRDGEIVTFRIDVANLGGTPIENVVVTELPGDGLADVVVSSPTQGNVEGYEWTVGGLDIGQIESVSVTASLTDSQGINRAFVEGDGHPHNGGFDPNDSLETDTDQGDTEIVNLGGQADLRIDKRLVSIETDAVNFEIEVCNLGSAPARETVIVDDGGLGIERTWSADPRYVDGSFHLGTLEPGHCEVVHVGADMSGSGYNVAYVTSPDDPIDPDANQPNDSIAEDIDGWDRVDTVLPAAPPVPGQVPQPQGAGPLPATGAGVGVLGLLGLVLLAGGIATRIRMS